MARRHRHKSAGKRIVYITPYRNSAVEMMKMYKQKGYESTIERETDKSGQMLFIVYTW